MKRILLLLLILLMAIVPLIGYTETELPEIYITTNIWTEKEAEEWLKLITYDELLRFIAYWFTVYQGDASLYIPNIIAFLDKKGDLYLTYNENFLVTLYGGLKWSVKAEDIVIKDFYSIKNEKKKKLTIFGGGILVGTILIVIILH